MLPAHKSRVVRRYVEELKGQLTLHFLPGYAPDLNPDELVWSYAKRTGVARSPLRQGENWRTGCMPSCPISQPGPTWCDPSSSIQVSPIFLTYE